MIETVPCRMNTTVAGAIPRNADLRQGYLRAAFPSIPRLVGAIDRNPFRPTYGCLDRSYWHYRTADFPSEMFQEGAWPLALAYSRPLENNPWFGVERVRDLAVAAVRFAVKSAHADGSCDDYYPFERALGSAVFSLVACAGTVAELGLVDGDLRTGLARRALWVARHDETGRLSNHHALAALGLLRVARLLGDSAFEREAERRLGRLLAWQSTEGWFEEYGGADPGYQTVTIDCLARYRALSGVSWLDEPLRRALRFARHFLHPDGSYAGEYGSRGTYHFYPHGMELLSSQFADAADLADGFLVSLKSGTTASFDDDRMYCHRIGSLIEAWSDWSAVRPPAEPSPSPSVTYFAKAQLLSQRHGGGRLVISAARGGVWKRISRDASAHLPDAAAASEGCDGTWPKNDEESHSHEAWNVLTDAGLILETADGRIAVSQRHGHSRTTLVSADGPPSAGFSLTVSGPLHWASFETLDPWKMIIFRLMLMTAGRWCRGLVRAALQRRLITDRRECPIRLTRTFESPAHAGPAGLRIVDRIELMNPRTVVRRLSIGTDHQADYVAAYGAYQPAVLQGGWPLDELVEKLNRERRAEWVRVFG
jgi:hypothetical protein